MEDCFAALLRLYAFMPRGYRGYRGYAITGGRVIASRVLETCATEASWNRLTQQKQWALLDSLMYRIELGLAGLFFEVSNGVNPSSEGLNAIRQLVESSADEIGWSELAWYLQASDPRGEALHNDQGVDYLANRWYSKLKPLLAFEQLAALRTLAEKRHLPDTI